ncbi:MAG: FlgD immunoglobulin-like domain containing protein [Candidatus Krumholzibacteria bacterium]|nr:FlgD immunoglobulin-like domain containing protein [Candidatus Krumholzibacteria bacterium]
MGARRLTGALCGALLIFTTPSSPARSGDFSSIQLVGAFGGITCEPDDPANEMAPAGPHLWRKLKFIDEPGAPDTILFKFTAEHSYMPGHWGWSFVHGWGIADYGWSPPSIAAVLFDCGYYEFFFDDSTFEYRIDRPGARIEGELLSDLPSVPDGASLMLVSAIDGPVAICPSFSGNLFSFDHLPEEEFAVTASAPGYRDTTVTGIIPHPGEPYWISLRLNPVTAVQVTSFSCERTGGGVLLAWTAYCCDRTGFDVYRSDAPVLESAVRRTAEPVFGTSSFSFFDECGSPQVDRWYWIVEIDSADPTVIGPIFAAGLPGVPSSAGQNYPNPFNPATTIPYTVGSASGSSAVVLEFYDVAGRLLSRHDLGVRSAGDHSFVWNPALAPGSIVPSGVYCCRVRIGKETFTRKMILLR